METADTIHPNSNPKSFIKFPQHKPSLWVVVAIIIIALLAIFGVYKLITRHRGPMPLESVAYMEKNCPITVPVNVFVRGGTTNEDLGVSVQGKNNTSTTVKKPSVQYTWTLSNKDDFCGIVGVWSGAKEVSLRPTSQTAHSGEYKDTSINNLNGSHLSEFIVYARPNGS